ncbi:MAG TPA: DEAD/DEAH box helicase [Candidatus Limnocylindrales bacterium]|jgi:ATP-dependent RNA helicase RhlE
MSFDALGLTPELLRAVADQGYTEPTPVQREAIPVVLAGRDLLAGAQTGTGKTAAFVLPILQRLNATRTPGWNAAAPTAPAAHADPRRGPRPPIRALVLTPTRELALQVEQSVRTYGAHRRIRSVAIYGGVGFGPQVQALRAGPGIVVATPGRLLDHAGQGTIDLSTVEILVLDEADRMLDMGFIRDIRRILALLPADRQNLLFSATFSDEIRSLASGLLRDPATVQVTPRNTATALVTQVVHPVDRERKRELLSHLIRSGRIEQALVFTRTKHGADRLAEQLHRDGITAAAIHGNKSQGQRVRALDAFKAGRVSILVATEVASRGLDIEQLPHVVNYELPMVAEDYVHRIGRTGRAGATGDAVSLVCVDEAPLLRDIEKLLGRPVPTEVVAGFEPDRSIRPEPIRQRSGGQRSAGPRFAAPMRDSGRRRGPAPHRGAPAPFHGGTAPRRERGPAVVHHGPIRHAAPMAGDRNHGPRNDQRPGAERPRHDRPGRHFGNPGAGRPQAPAPGAFRALPGEHLARADRRD